MAQTKEELLQQAKELSESTNLSKALMQINDLKKKWRKTREEEESMYDKEMNEKFYAYLDKLNAKEDEIISAVKESKQEIIEKAKQIVQKANYKNGNKEMDELLEEWKKTGRSNKKVDDEMNSKISEIKNCHTRLDKLQLGLSSKVAQYNYLLGTAKENVNDTQQIKDNIKKTNDNINKNNMIEVSDKIKKCSIEEIPGETKNYIKELNKDKINYMFDALVEIQNMMNVVNTNNKRNLNIVNGMNKEIERILKKNQI